VVPVGYQSEYPYSDSGKMPGPEDIPIPDPLLPLAYAAAITKNLRLATGVMILPQRHPAYVAKQMATLDLLSGGRAILGIGSGWLKEEFDVLGIPFQERGKRTDETIRAIRSLWQEKAEPFEGRFFKWNAVESHPKPVQRAGVPIVVGGHSEAAAKRAGRLGDGFFPGRSDLATLDQLLATMRAEASRVGRDAAKIEITAGTTDSSVDGYRRLADLGVSRAIIPPPAFDPDGVRKGLHEFAERVMSKV
jgi:probable F420-dependent oxidoreductase